MEVSDQLHAPASLSRYPLCKRLDLPQNMSDMVAKRYTLPEIESRLLVVVVVVVVVIVVVYSIC
jgi:hypothetical protein